MTDKIYNRLSDSIAQRIREILQEKHLTQRYLAKQFDKRESEISKWMSGRHNFTINTLEQIGNVLNTPIIEVPKTKKDSTYSSFNTDIVLFAAEPPLPYHTNEKIEPESQYTEYKESWRDEYLKWICGFANAQGGRLHIGIDDSRKIVGVENSKKLLEDIPNKALDVLGLVVDVDLVCNDGKDYIIINVPVCNTPITYKGKYYYRTGSTLQELNGNALNDFLMRKMNVTWDETINPDATINDIDADAVEYFKMMAVRAQRLSPESVNDSVETTLKRLKVMTEDGKLTMAALLLFGKDIEQWRVTSVFKIGRFGADASDLYIQDVISCPLIKMPNTIMDTLKTRYLVSPIHYEGMQRVEPLEIPEGALREMICNAIVHKDYLSTYIQMRVWNDRITIWNPGVMPPTLPIDKIMEDHDSTPRNGLIAKVFYMAGFIEAWGRGYEKIAKEFNENELKLPTFEEVRGGIKVTIPREKFVAISGMNVGSMSVQCRFNVGSELNERQNIILNLLETDGAYTASSLSIRLATTKRTIERDLAVLRNNGYIQKSGVSTKSPWIVLKKR